MSQQESIAMNPLEKKEQKSDKPKTLKDLLAQANVQSQIAKAVPKHITPDRLARVAMTELNRVPALRECDPASFIGAVLQCAQLGLEPSLGLGQAYLLPFKNKNKGITECQFIIGYRGMIDLARRSGQMVSLSAYAVYEYDEFDYELGLHPNLTHKPSQEADRGKLTFVYAVANLKDGGVQFEVMSRAQIDAIRAQSKAGKTDYSPWATHYEEMAKKTVIRRLFKYLPVSVEMSKAVGYDELAEAGVSQQNESILDDVDYNVLENVDTETGEVVNG
ncbi:recombination protein RecT [Gammaproteobacteria bacterium ESL0073]|nr:recombination protein RecT [Gammaproteobacteria bacterium ESL0073]